MSGHEVSGLPGSFGRNGIRLCEAFRRTDELKAVRGLPRGRNRRLGLFRRRRGRGSAAVDQFQKAAVSAQVLAIVTRLVAIDQFEGAGVVAEGAEGERATGGGVFHRTVRVVFCCDAGFSPDAHLVFHVGLFDAPDPHLAPTGDGHVFDEGDFDGCLRLKFGVQIGDERVEAFLGFAFQNDGAGEDAMERGIAGGGEFALGCDRTARLGAVSTGGLFLTFSTHATT